MFDLSKLQNNEMCYLLTAKMPCAFYYNCNNGEIDTWSFGKQYDNYKLGVDYEIMIRKNSIMHLFFNGKDRVYFMNSKGAIKMYIEVNDTQEFYIRYSGLKELKPLSELKIKEFIEYIKEFEE